jgi:hypothetical protein
MILRALRSAIKARRSYTKRRRTFLLLKDFTMFPEWTFCQILALAEWAKDVPGCVVECGVWRGSRTAPHLLPIRQFPGTSGGPRDRWTRRVEMAGRQDLTVLL